MKLKNIASKKSKDGFPQQAMGRRSFILNAAKTLGTAYFVVLNPFAAGFNSIRRAGATPPENAAGVHTIQGYSLSRAIYAMGTLFSITAVGAGRCAVQSAIDAAFAEIRQVEKLMSVHDASSQLSAVNRSSGKQMVAVDRKILEVAEASLKYGRLTDGALDVTVLPLMRLWGFFDDTKALPGSEALSKALSVVHGSSIRIDHKKGRIDVQQQGVQIDFGGIAKGYAVDRAARTLREKGMRSAIINGGGDLFALGAPPDAEAWEVGITNPLQPDAVFATTTLKDTAMATSGNYERYRMIDGKKYGHIIHPKTGLPVSEMLSATTTAPSALEADALSTAVFVLGQKQGMALLEDMRQVEGVLVAEKGSSHVEVSRGLRGRVRFNSFVMRDS